MLQDPNLAPLVTTGIQLDIFLGGGEIVFPAYLDQRIRSIVIDRAANWLGVVFEQVDQENPPAVRSLRLTVFRDHDAPPGGSLYLTSFLVTSAIGSPTARHLYAYLDDNANTLLGLPPSEHWPRFTV